jgi:hypothetical protein
VKESNYHLTDGRQDQNLLKRWPICVPVLSLWKIQVLWVLVYSSIVLFQRDIFSICIPTSNLPSVFSTWTSYYTSFKPDLRPNQLLCQVFYFCEWYHYYSSHTSSQPLSYLWFLLSLFISHYIVS